MSSKTRRRKHKRKRRNRKPKRTLKREQCSPKRASDMLGFSCYTSTALHKLKQAWNARHNDQKITSNSPRDIWEQLRDRMGNTCSTESCWLQHQCIKHDIDRSLWSTMFAPRGPKEWVKKPKEWLTTVDIQRVMKQWEASHPSFQFLGPSPIDYDKQQLFGECVWEELCKFSLKEKKKRGKTKIGIIFNLDTHTKPGSHWVAMYLDLKKHTAYYFDSYGDPIPTRIRKFYKTVQEQGRAFGENYRLIISKKRHQYSRSECGMYSMYFIVQMLLERPFSYFEKKKIRDKHMVWLRKKYFNLPKKA